MYFDNCLTLLMCLVFILTYNSYVYAKIRPPKGTIECLTIFYCVLTIYICSSQNAVYSDGGSLELGSCALANRLSDGGYTAWYLSKDHLEVGDIVRSRKPINAHKPKITDFPEGTVVALESGDDRESFVLVKIPGVHNPLRVQVSTVERVTFNLTIGDQVCLKEENNKHSSEGILHSIRRDGSATVGFIGLETLWRGSSSELQKTEGYYVGQFVRPKANVSTPRFEWPHKNGAAWATGRISQVLPNGCLVVSFPGRLVFGDESNTFLADPAEVEAVSFDTCPGVVQKYQHIEDFHWAVRPFAIACTLFTAMKLGLFVGQNIGARLKKGPKNSKHGDCQDGQTGANASWLPSPVANILFKEGVVAAPAAR